jgi:putative DNA primase/helicase
VGRPNTYFGASDTIYSREVGLRFMISAVARVMSPGCKADHVLILEGPQGSQKSTAACILAGERWFTDELSELGSKDAALQLRGRWIIEMAELDALRKSEATRIKAFLSRRTDRFRPPSGRAVATIPRQCVFIGTTNSDGYLKDESGGRRFWPIRCGRISVDAIGNDRDQLWAEAIHHYRSDTPWWMNDEVSRLAAEEQQERYVGDPWGCSDWTVR